MDTQNTAVAVEQPVVAAEQNATPAAPKATKAPRTAPTIVARKSLMGKWKKVGAPPKPIIGLTVNKARGKFTKFDIFERNGRTVSLLTINNRLKTLIKAKELVKTAETMKIEGPGRPAYLYSFDLTLAAPKRTRKGRKTAQTETAPVVAAETPAPVMAETPAPVVAEAPAPAVEAPAPAVVETPAAQ